MAGPQIVTFSQSGHDNDASNKPISLTGASIVIDSNDFVGVSIAANCLAEDLKLVSNADSSPVISLTSEDGVAAVSTDVAIIIGTIQSSRLIQRLIEQGQIDVGSVRGRWECFQTTVIDSPAGVDGCKSALVIVGSDKRGAIYGTFTISEQIGVSPWHWWADVPPQSHPEIYASRVTTTSREPSIKFRGMFINDESPALTGMVLEKFGKYGTEFYKRVFDLLLRLKANFLWPAMWPGYPYPGTSFFTDDAENQKTADDYGIMMSTSHHEPMQRLSNEWFVDNPEGSWSWFDNKDNITAFFDKGVSRAKGFESYFTMGIRGEYDESMKADDPTSVVNDVVRTQRQLFKKHHGSEDAVPQLLALYKEVQEYWDAGKLEVPDDVTLLFADDNFGSLRRLPTKDETNRKGGAGIYYHFEYVGAPRSYKWINSNSLGKTWHQLQEAYRRNARQIWVFNLGDIKPVEVPFSFAMALAYDINSITPSSIPRFLESQAERAFGLSLSKDVVSLWAEYDHLVSIRRHEHIEPKHFSLLHYQEADSILSRWRVLLDTAEALYATPQLHDKFKPAFFELVLHPIKASAIYVSLQITLARNQLWAVQRRTSANKAAQKVLDLFNADFQLSQEFHRLLGGKWNHMMRQTHYGFQETWHAPSRDMISGLCFVQAMQESNPIMGQMGVAVEGHIGVRPGLTNEASDFTHPTRGDRLPMVTLGKVTPYGPENRWFELYSSGPVPLQWQCTALFPWVKLSQQSGNLVPGEEDIRIYVSVDWKQVPVGFNERVLIDIRTTGGNYGVYGDDFEQVHLPVHNNSIDSALAFDGYVEADGYVSLPATRPSAGLSGHLIHPFAGRTGHGLISIDPKVTPSQHADPAVLSYKFYVFEGFEQATLRLYFNMTLDLDPTNPMEYDVALDDEPMTRHRLVDEPLQAGELPPGWRDAVQDCAWLKEHPLKSLGSGQRVLKIRMLHSNILLEKLVVDLGGVKEAYLGPPASRFLSL